MFSFVRVSQWPSGWGVMAHMGPMVWIHSGCKIKTRLPRYSSIWKDEWDGHEVTVACSMLHPPSCHATSCQVREVLLSNGHGHLNASTLHSSILSTIFSWVQLAFRCSNNFVFVSVLAVKNAGEISNSNWANTIEGQISLQVYYSDSS